jgi:hypothetical protein
MGTISRENSRTDILDGRKSGFGRSDTFIKEDENENGSLAEGEPEKMEEEETLDDQEPMIETGEEESLPFERPKSRLEEEARYEQAEPEPESEAMAMEQPVSAIIKRTVTEGAVEKMAGTESNDTLKPEPAQAASDQDEGLDDVEAALKRG